MASFCLPFNSMLKNNIKHTYFGKSVQLEYRNSSGQPSLEQIKRMEECRLMRRRALRGKTSTYRDYEIPQAPAFRVIDGGDVEEIIERLRTPTVASQGVIGDSERRCMASRRESNAKFLGLRKLNAAEEEALVARLLSPTHTSKIRSTRDPYRVMTEVNHVIPSGSLVVAKMRKESEEPLQLDEEAR